MGIEVESRHFLDRLSLLLLRGVEAWETLDGPMIILEKVLFSHRLFTLIPRAWTQQAVLHANDVARRHVDLDSWWALHYGLLVIMM